MKIVYHIEYGDIAISPQLFQQAHFLLFFKQTKEQQEESKIQIKLLRSKIKKGINNFPAIAIIRHPTYNFIADGNHRVYALYKEKIKKHEALFIKRK